MKEKHYQGILRWTEEHKSMKHLLRLLNWGLPWLLAALYLFMICICFFTYPVLLISMVMKPALCFLAVTLFRRILNFPRPYDIYHFIPLGSYHPGKGRSFPSRHTASAAIIALEIFHIWSGLGIFCIFIALVIGCLRIICGNHFIKDVAAAYAVALIIFLL